MNRQQAINIISQMIKDEEGFLSDNTVEAHKMAIKALEQEPTDKNFTKADIDAIVKAINDGWELRVNEVLDKIRAEIEAIIGEHKWDDYDFCSGLICARKIIDKYRAEVEPQERSDKE